MTDGEVLPAPGSRSRCYYGYIVVFMAFAIMMVAQGIFNSFGIVFNSLLVEFGWTRAMTSGAYSLSMLVRGASGILMGGLTDRFGPRVVLTFCGIGIGLGYMLLSRTSEVWHFYIFYGVLIGGGMGGVWVPLLSSIARWFDKKRGLMTGLVVSGVALGGLVAPPLISRMIEATDWRVSYLVQGGMVLVIMVLAAQFMRKPPRQPVIDAGDAGTAPAEHGMTLAAVIRTKQFWLIVATLFFSGYIVFSLQVHLVPHAIEMGISAVEASNLLAAMNGISLIGILGLAGTIGDRYGSRRVIIISLIMMLVAVVLLSFARELWSLYLVVIIVGVAFGAEGASESPLVAKLFGVGSHGLIFGVCGLGFTSGTAVGPLITGYIFDATGSYDIAFQVCIGVAILGLMAVFMLKPMKARL